MPLLTSLCKATRTGGDHTGERRDLHVGHLGGTASSGAAGSRTVSSPAVDLPDLALARVTLASGREIVLREAHLYATYDGLIEGYPTASMNDEILADLPARATQTLPGMPVHVVDPVRADPGQPPSVRFEPAETLPGVIVLGRFESTPVDLERDDIMSWSHLAIVWFQDDAHLPIATTAPPDLRRVDWDRFAEDVDF
jgi:hypothetical protein